MLSNIGLYAKAVVAGLIQSGVLTAVLADGAVTRTEIPVLIGAVASVLGVLLTPNAKTSEIPEPRRYDT